jgi:hypothetical protein
MRGYPTRILAELGRNTGDDCMNFAREGAIEDNRSTLSESAKRVQVFFSGVDVGYSISLKSFAPGMSSGQRLQIGGHFTNLPDVLLSLASLFCSG